MRFSHYRAENFYYYVAYPDEEGSTLSTEEDGEPYSLYQFPVDIDTIGNGTMLAEDKAITFMKWIRKAIEDGTLIKI